MNENLSDTISAKDVEFEAYKKLFYALIDIPSKTDSIKSKHDYVKARILDCVLKLERSGIDYRIRDWCIGNAKPMRYSVIINYD